MRASDLSSTLTALIPTKRPVFLWGPPGVGKSSLVAQSATNLALSVCDVRAVLLDPVDLRGIPAVNGDHRAHWCQPDFLPRDGQGVLFLDEAPEFPPRVMEALRVPLESGRIVLARSESTAVYPANFQLVLAANPCPCGLAETPGSECRCAPMVVRRYAARVSGPVLDRIDITQRLRPVKTALLARGVLPTEPSAVVAERVLAARERQLARLAGLGWRTNAEVPGPVLRKQLPVPAGVDLLTRAIARGQLSARGVDKVLRLAWTIADLAGVPTPQLDHLHAALAMRGGTELERGAA